MDRCLPEFDQVSVLASQLDASKTCLVPVFRRLFSDTLTPVMAYRRLVAPDTRDAPSFLFESVIDGDRIGRYSFLSARPTLQYIAHGQELTKIDHQSDPNEQEVQTLPCDDPLTELHKKLNEITCAKVEGLPGFTGGWVGYAGYDVVRYLEGDSLPKPPADDRGLPDLHFQFYRDLVAFDDVHKTVLVITHVELTAEADLKDEYAKAKARLSAMSQLLHTPCPMEHSVESHIDLASPPPTLPTSTMGEGGYQQAVEVCKKYIAAGDIFQVVPSQRFALQTKVDPFDVYRALRVVNPSPYMFYLQAHGSILVGSSPEVLVSVEDDPEWPGKKQLLNRPLAGTRRRGKTPVEDAQMEKELQNDPKDHAEHVMLVDLGRNDVGRVAEPGSIRLPGVLEIERYSHVMHLSSTVIGRLAQGMSAWDALRYTLPVGTVSGAPKVRAMQIIDELEVTRRGPYAGAVGYADFFGDMDMCIALRTMVVRRDHNKDQDTWTIHIQAGGGIVADSDPDEEHQETVNKAAALAKAVTVAEQAFSS